MFEWLTSQSDEIVWVLTYLNADCKFSESVAKLRQALTHSLLGINNPEPEPEPELHADNILNEDKRRLVMGVRDAVDQVCVILKHVRWSEKVRPLMGRVSEEGEPFAVKKSEPTQIIQMKQWVNALYYLEQGLRKIESNQLTPHLKLYAETKSNVYWAGSLAWNSLELKQLYQAIITPIHRSFHLITHTQLDLSSIFEDELSMISIVWEYWISKSQLHAQTTDVLNLSEKIGFFLGLVLDQLRPDELGGVNYSLVTRAAATLPECKRYFDKTPFAKQKRDLIVFCKKFLGDFGVDDQHLVKNLIELIYNALDSSSKQEKHLGELPAFDNGPVRRFFSVLFSEQRKQEKNLDDLQDTALKLKSALLYLQNGGILALINYIYIARHGWDLACVIRSESSVLRDEVQALIAQGVTYIRDSRLPKVLAFIDKLEETFMFASGFLSNPGNLMLNRYYRILVYPLPTPHLGSLLSPPFLYERFCLAEKRHTKYIEQLQFVSQVLKPCLARFKNANTTESIHHWPKFYRPLQQHFETISPKLSNQLLKILRSPTHNLTQFKIFFGEVEEYLNSLEKTHALTVKLNADVIQFTLLTLAKAHMQNEFRGLDAEGILFVPEQFKYKRQAYKFAKYLASASLQDNLNYASQRRLDGYLVTDISKNAPVRKIAIELKRLRERIKANLDPNTNTKSSLNMVHIVEILNYLEQSCVVLESLCDKHMYVSFVAQTIVLFRTWVFASAVLPPYYLEAKDAFFSESERLFDWVKQQIQYYDSNYREKRCGFMRVSRDPKLMHKDDEVRKQWGNQPAYVLFERKVFYISQNFEITTLCLRTGYFNRLNALFSQDFNVRRDAILDEFWEVDDLREITYITNHKLPSEDKMFLPTQQGFMFHAMNALEIFPMHIHALHAKQDELSEKSVLATHRRAFEGAENASRIMTASASLTGLLLESAAIWRLFSYVKAITKTFQRETYELAINDGLHDLNERFFFNVLHKIDLYEIKFGLMPALVSGKVECVIDKFFRGLLEPLGLSSNHYIALISNRAPYDRRFRSLPDKATTHQTHFREKHSENFFNQRADTARKNSIHEAMKREFKRLEDTRTGLQHTTNEMYFKAFEQFVRPAIDAGVKGDAGIEKQVCEILQIKMREFQALHDQDYRRLDEILDVIADLKKYLAVPADASLFETKETHRRKKRKVEQLEKIAQDTAQDLMHTPGAQIKKIRDVMQQDKFQETMLAYSNPDWLTYHAVKRAVLWLMECVGLYTPDCRTHYNHLVRSVHPETKYSPSSLIDLGLFNTPVPSHERVDEDEVVFSKFGINLNESLASCHEPP